MLAGLPAVLAAVLWSAGPGVPASPSRDEVAPALRGYPAFRRLEEEVFRKAEALIAGKKG